jgi:dolichyl-phosphate-mannose-protein mannosyltransferase
MTKAEKKTLLILFLILGLCIRLVLATLPGFRIDVDAWFAWALRLYSEGTPHFYSPAIWTNYTPGFLYILYLLGALKDFLHITDPQFYYLLKVPAIICDLILAWLVFNEVNEQPSGRDHRVLNKTTSTGLFLSPTTGNSSVGNSRVLVDNKKTNFFFALLAYLLILFNPSFIFNSSIWGQIDSILTLFMFLSIYFFVRRNLIISGIFWAVAILVKPQAIALSPVFLFFIIKNFSISNIFKLVFSSLLTLLILSIPFFTTTLGWGIFGLFKKMVGDYPYTSMFAYNFWGSFNFWVQDQTKFYFLTYQHWGYLLVTIFWIIIWGFYFKKKLSFYQLAALATLSFYFLPTRVHDRYLYPALVFLIVTATLSKNKLIITLTFFLSLIHFANLYQVYIYYNELFNATPQTIHSQLFQQPLYNLVDNSSKILSRISTLIFVGLSILIIWKNETKVKS